MSNECASSKERKGEWSWRDMSEVAMAMPRASSLGSRRKRGLTGTGMLRCTVWKKCMADKEGWDGRVPVIIRGRARGTEIRNGRVI